MKRRAFSVLLAGAVATSSLSASAQTAATPVVGWLNPQPLSATQQYIASFRTGISENGFSGDKDVTLELRSADGDAARLPKLAADLVQRKVAVIMAGSPQAALAAKRATETIPIVFTSGADPVKIGLVSSFNRPGGNVTGMHIQFVQLVGKRLAFLHELVPKAKRIAVLINPTNVSDGEPTIQNVREAGLTLGLEYQVFLAQTSAEIDAAFAAIVGWRADAVFVGPDPYFASRSKQIAALALRHALPSSFFERRLVEGEGLMSYGPDNADNYRQAGVYVGRILKGEHPGNLPVHQPFKYELVINLKTAKALGLTVPLTLLTSADDLIQ